jgi:hypothetical protein
MMSPRITSIRPCHSVALFNGEEVVLQRLAGNTTLNSDWDEWAEVAGLRTLVESREFRPLPQPLL